jgi:hypothetical protein
MTPMPRPRNFGKKPHSYMEKKRERELKAVEEAARRFHPALAPKKDRTPFSREMKSDVSQR